jgi:hypothetical protein
MSANDNSRSQGRTSTGVVHRARALFNVLADSPGRKRLLLLAIGLAIVISATALAQLRLNAWNKPFYDAIQHRDVETFLSELVVFGVIAGSLLLLNVAQRQPRRRSKQQRSRHAGALCAGGRSSSPFRAKLHFSMENLLQTISRHALTVEIAPAQNPELAAGNGTLQGGLALVSFVNRITFAGQILLLHIQTHRGKRRPCCAPQFGA